MICKEESLPSNRLDNTVWYPRNKRMLYSEMLFDPSNIRFFIGTFIFYDRKKVTKDSFDPSILWRIRRLKVVSPPALRYFLKFPLRDVRMIIKSCGYSFRGSDCIKKCIRKLGESKNQKKKYETFCIFRSNYS